MNARTVSRYKTPHYPTRLEVLDDHTLLEKHLPPAWKSCAEMAGVVTLLLAANNCTGFTPEVKRATMSKSAVVAPIFVHGEGRGATGCVAINPPVFLSEQDAIQVIREQLAKAGVALSASHVPLEGVTIPQKYHLFWIDQVLKVVPRIGTKSLVVDALDPQKRVGVKFATEANYFDLGGERSRSTVQEYDFKGIAGAVDKTVSSTGHGIYFGAFYDPASPVYDDADTRQLITLADERDKLNDPHTIAQNAKAMGRVDRQMQAEHEAVQLRVHILVVERDKLKDPHLIAQKDEEINRAYNDLLSPARARSRALLEQQVKDFIDWLKGQGVI